MYARPGNLSLPCTHVAEGELDRVAGERKSEVDNKMTSHQNLVMLLAFTMMVVAVSASRKDMGQVRRLSITVCQGFRSHGHSMSLWRIRTGNVRFTSANQNMQARTEIEGLIGLHKKHARRVSYNP